MEPNPDFATAFQRSGLEGRRIGRRTPTDGTIIEWHPIDVAERPRWGRRRGKVERVQIAELLDLSVSGAKVAVDETDPLSVGARVRIVLDGHGGIATVRRVAPGPDGTSIYGIQFLQLGPELQARVAKLLEGDRAYLEGRWKTAW